MDVCLEMVKRTHPVLLRTMAVHYSEPKGFVGRNICYLVKVADDCYGAIVGGSSTRFLPGRNEFFGITKWPDELVHVVNNIFFHVEPIGDRYPMRNFTTKVVREFRRQVAEDWEKKYGDEVRGFETLVELPRWGDLYRRDGWEEVGQTKGYTCKRTAGIGTDSWSGRRVWNTTDLRPKRVLCRLTGG